MALTVDEERVDLLRQVGDLLGQLLVLLRKVGVRLEQLKDLVGLRLRSPLEPALILLDSLGMHLVAIGLARLGEQDQRRSISGLEGEQEVQGDERVHVPGKPETQLGEFSTTHANTATVCPTMYCGVPKNLAAFSANRPNASLPNAPCSCALVLQLGYDFGCTASGGHESRVLGLAARSSPLSGPELARQNALGD